MFMTKWNKGLSSVGCDKGHLGSQEAGALSSPMLALLTEGCRLQQCDTPYMSTREELPSSMSTDLPSAQS